MLQLTGADVFQTLLVGLRGGVVHQDIDPPEFAPRYADQLFAVRLFTDIATYKHYRSAIITRPGRRIFCIAMLIQVTDHQVGAFFRKKKRHGLADTTVAAGDQGNLSLSACLILSFSGSLIAEPAASQFLYRAVAAFAANEVSVRSFYLLYLPCRHIARTIPACYRHALCLFSRPGLYCPGFSGWIFQFWPPLVAGNLAWLK